MREKLIEFLNNSFDKQYNKRCLLTAPHTADDLIADGVVVLPLGGIGEMSDGYHTFNELYHHRAVLFSVICNARPDLAWKSKLHDTGDMYEGMFIVGIETKEGQATYHYDIDPYWDMFNVPVLDRAPVWDGHTPQQAIDRIANGVVISNSETTTKWIPVTERLPQEGGRYMCNVKSFAFPGSFYQTILKYDKYGFREGHIYTDDVTHWMPLPEPPKGE